MKNLLISTRLHAPAGGRGSGGTPRLSARARAFVALENAIDKDSRAQAREEAARQKAIGESFTASIEAADEALVVAVSAGMEVRATKTNRKRIASHSLRPIEVDAIVAKRLAEIEMAKLAAEAERERPKAHVNKNSPEADEA